MSLFDFSVVLVPGNEPQHWVDVKMISLTFFAKIEIWANHAFESPSDDRRLFTIVANHAQMSGQNANRALVLLFCLFYLFLLFFFFLFLILLENEGFHVIIELQIVNNYTFLRHFLFFFVILCFFLWFIHLAFFLLF